MNYDIYHSFLSMFLLLREQFRPFDENQRMNMNDYESLPTALMDPQEMESEDFIQGLLELEEQSLVLEENIQRTKIDILEMRNSRSQCFRNVEELRERLENFQTRLRTAFETLTGRSMEEFPRRMMPSISTRHPVRARRPWRFKSCPNISSTPEDLGFDFLNNQWRSFNRTLNFKRHIEDRLQTHHKDLISLEKLFKQSRKTLTQIMYRARRPENVPSEQIEETPPPSPARRPENVPSEQLEETPPPSPARRPETVPSEQLEETPPPSPNRHTENNRTKVLLSGVFVQYERM
ncbi:uncharacterized protein LOC121902120 isoform X2 [Thunnus maccoyii]|uniref:uncharacterized protein LOC121902120 isoform X2 n=1 Tax=Thunnus maccoyii TaxID=8240 RepID=UPI001C4D85D2|nr:uncharacterized protein LOC121902120 isoform X2 [Thunnus maccoyii]